MPQPTTVHDFIDRGDECESGPPSSIGDYDTEDPFIDDNEALNEQQYEEHVEATVHAWENESPLFEPWSPEASQPRESIESDHGERAERLPTGADV